MARKSNQPTKRQILNEVTKRLPIASDKQLMRELEYAADNMADAYRIGAEAAQSIICNRINAVFNRADQPAPSLRQLKTVRDVHGQDWLAGPQLEPLL